MAEQTQVTISDGKVTKTTFAYSRQNIIVNQWHWAQCVDSKTGEKKYKWRKRGKTRYYFLACEGAIQRAMVESLLNEFDVYRGESVEELLGIFRDIQKRLGELSVEVETICTGKNKIKG